MQALNEAESQWTSEGRRVIATEGRGLRRCIPENFAYFHVAFGGGDVGYVHPIEDEDAWERSFGREVIGGMLDIPHTLWRRPRRRTAEEGRQAAERFSTIWRPFDWTLPPAPAAAE